ncbi:hypothetical protein SETIT_4G272800v2 [Setaria italica]|uniref:DUF1618 domain-containing protein n=1 Tax=Setaria italica TaxID=4555 RepID=A0A368QYT3_SETIT|nr:hypothetical protein SETIT_4G272800v2 [Setaria italica]
MASISLSNCVLLHADGFHGSSLQRNATTAMAFTSRGTSIEASLSCPERPLLPTILFVECSSVDDFTTEPPRIVRAVEDIIVFSVLIGPRLRPDVSPCDYDYFIYRVGEVPSLQLLPPPHPTFQDEDAGLLLCGEDDFIVAALIATNKSGVYDLHRFDSRSWTWSQEVVPLVAPQAAFPFRITLNSIRLGYHLTSTVITIGGEGGTMGWVDLWRGILICDVLHRKPELRGVPLPVPMELLTCNNGRGADIGGCGKSLRGIAVINQSLRFVHLEAIVSTTSKTLPAADSDSDDEEPDSLMSDWVITTWSNSKMSTSWDDWIKDCEAKASHTTIHSKPKSKMLNSGLLSPEGANQERALQNLWVSHPAPGIDDGVVYLLARVRFQDPKAFVIALDARKNVLLGSAEFATEKKRGDGVMYFPSNISKYIAPEARVLPITTDGWEESSLHEGTENVEIPSLPIYFPGYGFE